MKARVFFYALVLAMVFLIARATAAAGNDPPPTTTTTTLPPTTTVDATVQGKTAGQWHRVAARYRRSLQAVTHTTPPWGTSWLERAFLCIHSFEGRWTDPGAPYWGGIQMDKRFMQTYMPWAYRTWGTADHWPVSVQLAAGIHAFVSGRGFHPWPNTARFCGLLP